ncbi:hypothetical protein [Mycobacteroides chelonae]|uniref:hypothetical protein n=1 Tax=Mycobacteroides chelonae TaxID=1774 RepID=UPI0012FF811B|nr:hypothetical protein [Mycobacteroides chelonae]
MANPKGKKRRPRRRVIAAHYLPIGREPYNPCELPEDQVLKDKIVSVLGAPIDGYKFELVYRYTLFQGLFVDWAIMIYALKTAGGLDAERLRVERIDICHSEVHKHTFGRSSPADDDLGHRTVIQSLSAGDEAIVDREYDKQLALVSREWQLRARRWLDG